MKTTQKIWIGLLERMLLSSCGVDNGINETDTILRQYMSKIPILLLNQVHHLQWCQRNPPLFGRFLSLLMNFHGDDGVNGPEL
jgi:hypothetical protein